MADCLPGAVLPWGACLNGSSDTPDNRETFAEIRYALECTVGLRYCLMGHQGEKARSPSVAATRRKGTRSHQSLRMDWGR